MVEPVEIPDKPPYGDPEFEAWFDCQPCSRCGYIPDDCTCPYACINWRDFYRDKSE